MRYLPSTMRLKREGIVIRMTGMPDYHEGSIIIDLHAALGKYELEEEFAKIVENAFNAFMDLQQKLYR